MRDVWFMSMVKFVCVSLRMQMVFKFQEIQACLDVAYGLSEGDVDKECGIFQDNFKDVLHRVSISFREIVLKDLNCWIGDRKMNDATGAFEVEEETENGSTLQCKYIL